MEHKSLKKKYKNKFPVKIDVVFFLISKYEITIRLKKYATSY